MMWTKNRWIIFSLFLGLFLELNCGDGMPFEPENRQVPMIGFETRSFSKYLQPCSADSMRCASIRAQYPWAVEGPAAVCDRINDSIFFHLRFSLAVFAPTVADIPASLDSVAGQLISEYQAILTRQPNYRIPWEARTDSKILFQSAKIISVQISNYSFIGGAHPNTHTNLLNFDTHTGKVIDLENLLLNRKALEKLVETEFRKIHQLKSGQTINESGFFWGELFRLPDNIAVVKNGLYFFYNPYEVADYAAGPTDFVIPYERLNGMVAMDRIF